MPGTALTVPGAFKLEVLPPAATGASQVKTTWLDKTPPVIKSIKARIDKPWGAPSGTLIVDLVGTADGAGIAAVNVKAGSKTTKFDADTLTDLIAGKGRASVRIKAPRSGIVRTTLVDAAGRSSAVKSLKVSKLKTTRRAGITYAPKGGAGYYTAPTVPAGTKLRVNVRTDPKTAGLSVYVWALGPGNAKPKLAKISKSGRASTTVALPRGDAIQVVVQVPKSRNRWVDQPPALVPRRLGQPAVAGGRDHQLVRQAAHVLCGQVAHGRRDVGLADQCAGRHGGGALGRLRRLDGGVDDQQRHVDVLLAQLLRRRVHERAGGRGTRGPGTAAGHGPAGRSTRDLHDRAARPGRAEGARRELEEDRALLGDRRAPLPDALDTRVGDRPAAPWPAGRAAGGDRVHEQRGSTVDCRRLLQRPGESVGIGRVGRQRQRAELTRTIE